MSGQVANNISVASGSIAAAASATESSVIPTKDTNPEDVGAEWHNTTTGEILICNDNTVDANSWIGQIDTQVGTPFMGDRAVWAGGNLTGGGSPTVTNRIQYNTIDSTGNATDFGDLVTAAGGGPKLGAVAGGAAPTVIVYDALAKAISGCGFGPGPVLTIPPPPPPPP